MPEEWSIAIPLGGITCSREDGMQCMDRSGVGFKTNRKGATFYR